jgi:hypothetical protein
MDHERHARQLKANRFNISALTHSDYHGGCNGFSYITAAYLQSCGYTSFSSDVVVTCFNNIILVHKQVYTLWTNMTTNMAGPQVERILQKSIKLFPMLESTTTGNVVDFYDRLHEISPLHLLGIIPFDMIMLRNWFKGLCIPGLGIMQYAAMGKALMELLPHLISGRFSPQINAALASARYKTNNGYDFLWRVLELTVPGFNPVIPIQTPIWSDIGDIFRFAQAYLLYFRLQGKMNVHYDDRTRSGIFLQAIQYTEFSDMVMTLQSHVNSYQEQFKYEYLPPNLHLHGLATSIHQNAMARLCDIATPWVQRFDGGSLLVQGVPIIN